MRVAEMRVRNEEVDMPFLFHLATLAEDPMQSEEGGEWQRESLGK